MWRRALFGSTIGSERTLTPTYTPAAADAGTTVTLTLTVSNAPCTAATATYSVNVKAKRTATAEGSKINCENGSIIKRKATSSNGTIIWTENGAGTITADTTTL